MENKISVVMPCLNESLTLGSCIQTAQTTLSKLGLHGEVIVVDNGSSDNSVSIAKNHQAKIIYEPQRGYGAAYLKGFREARGDFIVMGDSDGTYDFSHIGHLIKYLEEGYDVVIGSRLSGNIQKGAMPWLHRYIGTPFLSFLLNFFFRTGISDINSGMRAFSKKAYEKMNLSSEGMELASEIVIKSKKNHLKIQEVPISYYKREGQSKLHPLKDGWRHLSLILAYSSTKLFMIPSLFFLSLWAIVTLIFAGGPITFGNLKFDYHYMLASSVTTILSFQILSSLFLIKGFLANKYRCSQDKLFASAYHYLLKKGPLCGLLSLAVGTGIGLYIIFVWVHGHFGALHEIRSGLLSITFLIIGIQFLCSSFIVRFIDDRLI